MKRRILLADCDSGLISIRSLRLRIDGYEVMEARDGAAARSALEAFRPDVLLLDPAIPGGEALMPWIREHHLFDTMKIVLNTARDCDTDEVSFCRDLGADAYIAKPAEHDRLLRTLDKVLRDEMVVTFWGTRGGMARPGVDTLKFGGNTPCVSVELSKDRYFVFDAGSGIADFGRALVKQARHYRFNLFLSSPRWEHVHGLPYFEPLRREGNDMVIHGPAGESSSLRAALAAHAAHVCRPVRFDDYASRPHFHEMGEGEYRVDGLRVTTLMLQHPAEALGYRLEADSGQVFAYLADNEIIPGDQRAHERLRAFVAGADLLVHNASWFDHEYLKNRGRGGSPLSEVAQLAADAGVRSLHLFRHEPEHDDEALSAMEEFARGYLEERGLPSVCQVAREGTTLHLEAVESARSVRLIQRARPSALHTLPH